MNLFKISLQPLSLFQTPLRSGTIWGHICWAIRFLKGESELKNFLAEYKRGNFPIIVSDAFPDGYLPIPRHPGIIKDFDKTKSDIDLKKLKKAKYIPISVYEKLEESFDAFLENFKTYFSNKDSMQDSIDNYFIKFDEWHCSINRVTGNVEMGMLFSKECSYFKGKPIPVIYVKSVFDKPYIEKIFKFIGENGYGADASVGRGRFEFDISDANLPDSKNPNSFVTLSHGFEKVSEFKRCFYDVDIKFGKVGNNISYNPFKRPTVSFKPGSLFILKEDGQPSIAYGKVKDNIHSSIDFVHECSLLFPLYVRWQNE
ncbi:MAG: type III-A CRISPR-associated RAMP protein Csm4 [Thermodesulfobium sp.]